MVKTLGMFQVGSWEEATSKLEKIPTTTKWIDRVMPPLEAKQALFADVAGVREET